MLIACDVDNVVAGLYDEWLRRYNEEYDDTLTVAQLTSWDIASLVKPECGDRIFKYLQAPDLYECVRPLDGALEGVTRIRQLGHEFLFTTSCHYGMVDQKARWMERERFCLPPSGRRLLEPNLLPDDFVAITPKTRIMADLLIDDGGHHVKQWIEKTRRRAILFEYPHNRDLDMTSINWGWCSRVSSWAEIVQLLERQA